MNYNTVSKAAVKVTHKIGVNGTFEAGEAVTTTIADGEEKNAIFDNEYPSGKLTVHVTEEKSGKDVPEAEVEVKYPDGTTTKTYTTNEKGEITDENGDVLEVLPGDYTVTVTKVPEGYEVKTGESDIVNVPENDEGHHEAVIATDRGGIIITVLDEKTGEPVSGATVEVTEPGGETKTYTTDENGQVTDYAEKDEYDNYTAEPGDYTYKVTKVPDGYHVTVGEEQTGTVETGKLTELEAKIDIDTGKLTVHVIEKTSERDVPGAEVEVEYPDGTKKTFTTDENGEIKDEDGNDVIVPTGEYKVTVTKVPDGYDVTTGETGTVVVPRDDEGHHDAVIETERGGIIITVIDEKTGEPVSNATVEVTEPDGTTKTYTTDENGQVTDYTEKDEYGNYTAEPGDYTYKVTKVPDGYHVTVGEEQTGTVEPGKLTELEAKIATDTGKLTVHVTEKKSGDDVPDAEVEVEYPDGTKKTFTTDENGEIKDEDGNDVIVPTGEYKITVIKVPDGYDVTTGETGTVVVPKDGEGHHDAVIKTDRGALIITVLDEETGEPVENAEIVLTTPDGETHTYVTDENGQITDYAETDEFGNFTAETGDYIYIVTKVPEGYRVTVGEEREGEVKPGELTELESKIAHSTGGLDIVVRDEKTKKPVPGATVEVVYPDGSTHTFVTDENGMVTELAETDEEGHYLTKTGEYKITVVKVPDGYTVTTGKTATEVVETDTLKHHVAEVATASSSDRKPPERTAQTGDETPITMLFILMMISAGGFAGAFFGKRRQSKKRAQK
jgi:5-hydroxyisourate hydrolase-like protein (transthyretin family)